MCNYIKKTGQEQKTIGEYHQRGQGEQWSRIVLGIQEQIWVIVECVIIHIRRKSQFWQKKQQYLVFSVIHKSCKRPLNGKTYWKSVVQPRTLNASSFIAWCREERKKLQIVENRVWRQILRAPVYTPVAALYGEIGASTVEGRDRRD